MLLTQMAEGVRVPDLPWASFIPAHFLSIWKRFPYYSSNGQSDHIQKR